MAASDATVLKLIPEYSGEGDIAEWLEKVELVCELRGITDVATVVPLRLTGSAFAVYQQLPTEKKSKAKDVKASLIAAFATNSFAAYEQFTSRRMKVGESPDVFLASLRTLAGLFGGVSEKTLLCAFVTGLPDGVKQVLRAGANIDGMKLETVLVRARAVLVDEGNGKACGVACVKNCDGRRDVHGAEEASVAMATTSLRAETDGRGRQGCFKCGGPNHIAKHCRLGMRNIKCFKCDEMGHVAAKCRKNKTATPQGNE